MQVVKGACAIVFAVIACSGRGAPLPCPASIVIPPFGLAVDATYVYWAEEDGFGTIWRAPIAGGERDVMVQLGAGRYPQTLVLDGGAMFASGGCSGEVWRVPLDGGVPTALFRLTDDACIQGVAVDASDVYFTNGTVSKVPRTGGAPIVLVPAPTGGFGCDGALVASATDLYWVGHCSGFGGTSGALSSVPIAGGAAVAIDPAAPGGEAIAIDAANVYWASGGMIRSLPLAGGPARAIAPTDTVFGIAVDATDVYWTTASSVMKAPLAGGAPTTLAATGGRAAIAVDASRVYWGAGDVCPADSAPK
jgi:hypothetical protein